MCEIILADYAYKSKFILVDGLRIHYIDEGNHSGPVILFLHGVPTWSYTFRKIFPECLKSGNRVIAPDIPGFGKSDKPADPKGFTLDQLTAWMDEFLVSLGLKNIFLFAHDWGVIIGLILAAKKPEVFSGIIACNGFLPVIGQKVPFMFQFWKFFSRYSPLLPIGRIVDFACHKRLTRAERRAYDLPFANQKDKVAVRVLPQLIPIYEGQPGSSLIEQTWSEMKEWNKPFLTIFSDSDPVTRGGDEILQDRIQGTRKQDNRILKGKHFLQEDAPLEIADIINEFVKNNS